MKAWKVLLIAILFVPLTLGAETISWTSSPNWDDGTPVSQADAAKFTFYLRIWRATNPDAVFYFGETRNGVNTWTDNILVKANQYVTPPLVPGDNVFIGVSAAFSYNDGTPELDSWTKSRLPNVAYMIPKASPVNPAPVIASFAGSPATIVKGSCSTLSWSVTNATTVALDNGIGAVTGTSRSVCPPATTAYVLTATGPGGVKTATATVIVTTPISPGCNPPTNIQIKP